MDEHVRIISKSFNILSYVCATHTHTHTHTHRYKSKCNGLYPYLSNVVTILNKKKNLSLYLPALGLICSPWALHCGMWGFFLVVTLRISFVSCSMWNLVPRPGIKPGAPALGAWSLSRWITREAPLF